jgi:hypothetical protein
MRCERAVRAVTLEDLSPSAYQARPLLGTTVDTSLITGLAVAV